MKFLVIAFVAASTFAALDSPDLGSVVVDERVSEESIDMPHPDDSEDPMWEAYSFGSDEDNPARFFDMEEHQVNFKEYTTYQTIKEQPIEYQEMEVELEDILQSIDYNMDPHTEVVGDAKVSGGDGRKWTVYGTKADGWCFIRMVHHDDERKFFFKCSHLVDDKAIWLRVLNENCPYPKTEKPEPPTERECTVYAMQAESIVRETVDAYGEASASSLVECFILVIETTQPRIKTRCTEEALIGKWKAATNQDLSGF